MAGPPSHGPTVIPTLNADVLVPATSGLASPAALNTLVFSAGLMPKPKAPSKGTQPIMTSAEPTKTAISADTTTTPVSPAYKQAARVRVGQPAADRDAGEGARAVGHEDRGDPPGRYPGAAGQQRRQVAERDEQRPGRQRGRQVREPQPPVGHGAQLRTQFPARVPGRRAHDGQHRGHRQHG